MTRIHAIGTRKNHVIFDVGETGVWLTIFNENTCLGYYFERDHKNVRIMRDGKEIRIIIGDFRFWVKARWL